MAKKHNIRLPEGDVGDLHEHLVSKGLPVSGIDSLGNIELTEDVTEKQLSDALKTFSKAAKDAEKKDRSDFLAWRDKYLYNEWEAQGKP